MATATVTDSDNPRVPLLSGVPPRFSTPTRVRTYSYVRREDQPGEVFETERIISSQEFRSDYKSISPVYVNGKIENGLPGSHCHSDQKPTPVDYQARRKLIIASGLCLIFMIGEIVGGVIANSLAIMTDSAHLLTDFASFMISLVSLYLATRPATKAMSFGWYRAEIVGALVSVLLIWVVTGILVYMAALRVMNGDYEIDAMVMLITAAVGVAINIIMGLTLHQHGHGHGGHGHSHGGDSGHSHGKVKTPKSHDDGFSKSHENSIGHSHEGHGHSHSHGDSTHEKDIEKCADNKVDTLNDTGKKEVNINVRAAFIHVLGDLLLSIGVLTAALIIYFKPELKIMDPICTFVFSVLVLCTTIFIMRDIMVVLMEGTPKGISFSDVRDSFLEIEGILEVHNLRLWSLTMTKVALSVHLAVTPGNTDQLDIMKKSSSMIQERFGITESTIQIEEYVTDMIDCEHCQDPKD